MTDGDQGILAPAWGTVWRHQRVLWWVLAVNFLLGALGASGAARSLSGALSHSLAGNELSRGFNLGMFLELVEQPDVQLFRHAGGSILFAVLFFLFMLFVTPGIIAAYFEDRRFTTGEFFGAAGSFFWSFVRLMLWSLIPFTLVNLLYQGVSALSNYIGDRAVADQTGFYILVAGSVPVLLLFLWVRLWFDLAQVRAVALGERAMRRNVIRAFRMPLHRIYWPYFLIGVVVWVVTIIALGIWAKLPPTAVPVTFLLLELIMFAHIFGRLWQKACATTWYRLNPEPVPVMPSPLPPLVTEPFAPNPAVEPVNYGVAPDIDAPLSEEVEAAPEFPRMRPSPEPPVKPE